MAGRLLDRTGSVPGGTAGKGSFIPGRLQMKVTHSSALGNADPASGFIVYESSPVTSACVTLLLTQKVTDWQEKRVHQSHLCLWSECLIMTAGTWVLCGLRTLSGDIADCPGSSTFMFIA